MSKQKTKVQDLFSVVDFDDNDVVEKVNNKIEKSDYEKKDISNNEIKSEVEMKQKEYKKYSVEEVKEATIKYFGGDQLAADVWMNKYALKDSDGNIFELTPDDMHHRIASEIARIENRYPNPMSEEELFEVLKDFRYIVPHTARLPQATFPLMQIAP